MSLGNLPSPGRSSSLWEWDQRSGVPPLTCTPWHRPPGQVCIRCKWRSGMQAKGTGVGAIWDAPTIERDLKGSLGDQLTTSERRDEGGVQVTAGSRDVVIAWTPKTGIVIRMARPAKCHRSQVSTRTMAPPMATAVPATACQPTFSRKTKASTGSRNTGGRAMRALAMPISVSWMATRESHTPM